MPQLTEIDYLLNRFEAASQADEPAKHGYGHHRRALYAYVRGLEAQAREIEALRADAARLDLVLSRGAFLVESKTDAGGIAYQLTTQDEDECYHAISGADRFFATPRAAIDAALAEAAAVPEAGGLE